MKKEYLDKLAEILQAHAPEETILVCASRIEGRRILAAVAAQGHVLVGVRYETPFSLARELCAAKLSEPGAPRLIEEVEGADLVRSCIGKNTGIFSGVNAKTLSATRAFYRAFQELALAGHTVDLAVDSPKLQELQQMWADYIAKKAEDNLLDRADLFALALEEAKKPNSLHRAHYVVLGDYTPALLERQLLESLSAPDRLTVVDLPCGKDLSARSVDTENQYLPIGAMAERLPRVDVMETLKTNSRFVACRGVETEVRFPLRDILDKELPLEDCAIVYLNGSYALPLYEEAARFHLPATLGGGLPLVGSRLYTTLKKVKELPKNEFYAEDVCALLESGCCGPKEWPVKLAERMRDKKVGWGRERYNLAWEYDEQERGKPASYTTKQWKDWLEDCQKFLTLLLAVAQPENDLAQQRTDMVAFLKYCFQGNGSEAVACSKAQNLAERITSLEEGETLLDRLLNLMETTSYMGGAVESGKLYLAPLSQATCTNRKHLYIVGFSRYGLQGNRKESPILLDKEREALGGLKTSIQLGREQEFRLLTLLARHEGDVVLTYPDFNSDGMLVQEPAPFFRDAAGERVEHVSYLPKTVRVPADELLRQEDMKEQKPQAEEPGEGEAVELQPKKTRKEMLKELTFSATSLDKALHCPYAFYLQYVMHVRAPQIVKRNDERWLDAKTIGDFCHAVLEEYYQQPEGADWEPIFDKAYVQLKRNIPMPDPALEEEEKATLHTIVERAIAWTAAEGRKVLATEEKLHQSGQPLPMAFGNWTIYMRGSIDRVDQLSDGSIAILDYKTGDPEKYKNDMYRHWQHYLYTVAEEQLHVDRKVSKAGYLFLQEDADLLELDENDEQRELLEKRIEWLLDRISAEDYELERAPFFQEKKKDPKKPDDPIVNPWELEPSGNGADWEECRYCEFKAICPQKKGGEQK